MIHIAVFCSVAGAVKFGDNLSLAVCVSLLKNLSFCDVPFYCAHGRPLMAPLLNLSKLGHLGKKVRQKFAKN